jgi:hypothetical protein
MIYISSILSIVRLDGKNYLNNCKVKEEDDEIKLIGIC